MKKTLLIKNAQSVLFFFFCVCHKLLFYRGYGVCGVLHNMLAFIFIFYLAHMKDQIFDIFKCVGFGHNAVIVSMKMMELMKFSHCNHS